MLSEQDHTLSPAHCQAPNWIATWPCNSHQGTITRLAGHSTLSYGVAHQRMTNQYFLIQVLLSQKTLLAWGSPKDATPQPGQVTPNPNRFAPPQCPEVPRVLEEGSRNIQNILETSIP